jgi:hypothetical protein
MSDFTKPENASKGFKFNILLLALLSFFLTILQYLTKKNNFQSTAMSDFTKPENMTGNYIRNIYMCNFKIVKYRDLRILKYFTL